MQNYFNENFFFSSPFDTLQNLWSFKLQIEMIEVKQIRSLYFIQAHATWNPPNIFTILIMSCCKYKWKWQSVDLLRHNFKTFGECQHQSLKILVPTALVYICHDGSIKFWKSRFNLQFFLWKLI